MTGFATKSLAADSGSYALDLLRDTLRHHTWMLAIIAGYIGLVVAVLTAIDRPYTIFDRLYIATALVPPIFAALCVVLGQLVFHAMHVRPISPTRLLSDLRQDDKLRPSRLVYAAIPIPTLITSYEMNFANAQHSR